MWLVGCEVIYFSIHATYRETLKYTYVLFVYKSHSASFIRVKSQVQEKIEKCKHVWIELVDDLWESENLKHLRDAATPYEELEPGFIYDPCTQQYGFEAWATLDISPLKLDDESEQIHKDTMAPEPNPLHDDDVAQEAYSSKYM